MRNTAGMPREPALARFLHAVDEVRSTGAGVPETSYYPAVSQLLDEVGAGLTPRVKAVIHLSDTGGGIPDGGLFVVRPGGPAHAADPLTITAPDRGAVEVKPPSDEMARVLASEQVARYTTRYGKVLVTTLRDWALVTTDAGTGSVRRVSGTTLAASPSEFWALCRDPSSLAPGAEPEFLTFLESALSGDAPLSSPQELAWVLASHARTALSRIESRTTSSLDRLRTAITDSLGLTFEGDQGERFFRSTLVQTLFYGVFSAWVLWHQTDPPPDARFESRTAQWYLRVPMVGVLFEQITVPSVLRRLGLDELLDWTDDLLARVDRHAFFGRFAEDDAVQYFYEPFLEQFDPELRKQFGVWYTPRPVVDYMVDKVDRTLRDEFGYRDGLADERVYVLDPCVGTGSYLLSVMDRIAAHHGDDALAGEDLKRAARTRLYGFELLPAPFVVAHLQLGLRLARHGAPLDPAAGERVAVYLTNALTGWGTDGKPPTLPFPELEEEREAAHAAKRDQRVVVVLGNPPYNPFQGVASEQEAALIDAYRRGVTTRNSLADLYVQFFGLAQRQIVEGAGRGVVCLVTNFSYLHEPGFGQMRRVLLDAFDDVTIDCLNGDSRETGKRTPEGLPDPSVFSSRNNPGIQVGTAIGTFVRTDGHRPEQARVRYRDLWGDRKHDQLRIDAAAASSPGYKQVELSSVNRYSLRPTRWSQEYETWASVPELSAEPPMLGLNENRGSALIDPDRDALAGAMREYLDPAVGDARLAGAAGRTLMREWAGHNPVDTRRRLLVNGGFRPERLLRFVSRPLDVQWAYVDDTRTLWNRPRSEFISTLRDGSRYLVVRNRAPRANDGAAVLPASCLGDQHALHKDAYFVPRVLHRDEGQLFGAGDAVPNLSPHASAYLYEIGAPPNGAQGADLLWRHVLAVGYSPQYLADNGGGVSADFPRVPLPATAAALGTSAALGARLERLLDPLVDATDADGEPVDGAGGGGWTTRVGALRRTGGGPVRASRGDLSVNVGWGRAHSATKVFPGRGRLVQREPTGEESERFGGSAVALSPVVDVYLNADTLWSCVPLPAWEFRIGGFQVLKKWLSYREHGEGPPLLGRSLTVAEAREFTDLARRLTVVVLLADELDASFAAVAQDCWQWKPGATPRTTPAA